MKIEQIYTGCLAQGAYFIQSNGEAVVIDPLREVQPVQPACVWVHLACLQFLSAACQPSGKECRPSACGRDRSWEIPSAAGW